ncbi:MAG: hypothetical protein QW272_09725 [Candidatus Methanomethylicaceae archaeon]
MPIKTWRVYFWKDEEIGSPPAISTKEILFKNLISATLTADINLYNLWHWTHLDSISLNGNILPGSSGPDGAHKTYDVTPYIRDGVNTVRLDYTGGWLIGPWGRATVYMDITAEEVKVAIPPTPIKLEWWHWLIIAGFGIAGVYLIASALLKK